MVKLGGLDRRWRRDSRDTTTDHGNGGTTSANTTSTADQLQQQLGFPLVDLLH
jgi:hypothetical protein